MGRCDQEEKGEGREGSGQGEGGREVCEGHTTLHVLERTPSIGVGKMIPAKHRITIFKGLIRMKGAGRNVEGCRR